MMFITSNQHDTNGEYLLAVRCRRNITESNRSQTTECKVQRCDVARLDGVEKKRKFSFGSSQFGH